MKNWSFKSGLILALIRTKTKGLPMKKMVLVLFMIVIIALHQGGFAQSPKAAEVDCIECQTRPLVDESAVNEVQMRSRDLSSLAEEAHRHGNPDAEIKGMAHPVSAQSRSMGRAPSITTPVEYSFVLPADAKF
jgi:hypothetical protein